MRLDAQTLREPVRASFPAQAAAVLDCRVYPDAQALERTDDGVAVHVPLRADIVYTDADGAVQSETFRTEVSCHTALSEDGLCEAVCMLQPEGYASAGSGAVELRYDAVFQVQTFSRQTLQNLSGCRALLDGISALACRKRGRPDFAVTEAPHRLSAARHRLVLPGSDRFHGFPDRA